MGFLFPESGGQNSWAPLRFNNNLWLSCSCKNLNRCGNVKILAIAQMCAFFDGEIPELFFFWITKWQVSKHAHGHLSYTNTIFRLHYPATSGTTLFRVEPAASSACQSPPLHHHHHPCLGIYRIISSSWHTCNCNGGWQLNCSVYRGLFRRQWTKPESWTKCGLWTKPGLTQRQKTPKVCHELVPLFDLCIIRYRNTSWKQEKCRHWGHVWDFDTTAILFP